MDGDEPLYFPAGAGSNKACSPIDNRYCRPDASAAYLQNLRTHPRYMGPKGPFFMSKKATPYSILSTVLSGGSSGLPDRFYYYGGGEKEKTLYVDYGYTADLLLAL